MNDQQTQPEPQPEQQASPGRAIAPIEKIQRHFMKEAVMAKIASHCQTDIAGVERIVRGLLNAVRRSQDSELVNCTPASFVNCIYDTHALGLSIDRREHCYLIRYNKEATVQPGYKGYLFRLEKSLNGFFHKEFIWWEEEEFTYWDENGQAKYTYKPKKAARSDYEKAIGVAIYISYWINGEKVSIIEAIDKAELAKIRRSAKSDKVWSQWLGEQYQKAVIKRACKERFSSLTADLDEKDNEHHSLDNLEDDKPKSAAQRFQEKMSGEKYNPFPGEQAEPIDASFSVVPEESVAPMAQEAATEAHPYDGVPEWRGDLWKVEVDGIVSLGQFQLTAAYGRAVAEVAKLKTRIERDNFVYANKPFMAALYDNNRKIHDALLAMADQGEDTPVEQPTPTQGDDNDRRHDQ